MIPVPIRRVTITAVLSKESSIETTLYGVFDYSGAFDLEAGIGLGLTDSSDKLPFKLISSKDLNRPPGPRTSIKSGP